MKKKKYIKVKLGGQLINIEVTNSIPDGYVLYDYFLAVNYII